MTMALLSSSSSPTPTLSSPSSTKLHTHKPYLLTLLSFTKQPTKSHKFSIRVSSDNGAGAVVSSSTVDVGLTTSAVTTDDNAPGTTTATTTTTTATEDAPPSAAAAAAATKVEENEVSVGPTTAEVKKFRNPKWVNGTWDLQQFSKNGSTDWDAVIDAEAKRRKWLEAYPESTSNDEPIIFDTSIIPWWAWIKRFHLPEAELLNGRAAMIGFFMSYFVDSLTGVGVVDQMSNFFCKTLLFVAVLGVLLIRKNEDVENLKKLLEETTFYDKQWQATWEEETNSTSKKD